MSNQKRQEYFDMSAETAVAELLGDPLSPEEYISIYKVNINEGRIPINDIPFRGIRNKGAEMLDRDVNYVMDHSE